MDLIGLLLYILIFGLIFGLLVWLIKYMSLPEPFGKVAVAIVCLIAIIVLLGVLFGGVNVPQLRYR